MRQRTQSRELALQAIYRLNFQEEAAGVDITALLDELIKSFSSLLDNNPAPIINYARELIEGYLQNQNRVNDAIKKSSANWEFQRIALIDRTILQIAVYELLFRTDIPQAVSINEAIELAKKYGGQDSSNFVNGILDKIASENKK
jgi:N utilization substance protein B